MDGEIKRVDEPALTALNMRLRDDYTVDCAKGVERWNKVIEKTGVQFQLELPHVAFHRQIGEFKNMQRDADGRSCSTMRPGRRRRDEWLPSKADGDFIADADEAGDASRGKFAGWIAPPKVGIDNKPGDFEYVKIAA